MALPAVLIALVAGACGSDDNGDPSKTGAARFSCATGSISGAGSTFVQTITQQWIKDFGAKCAGATVNYQGVGSGAGIQQFTAGTVDFAGSDVAMKPLEQAAAEARYGPVLHIPWSAGGIAVEYNVSGVSELKLSPATLAAVFAGRITRWDDAALKADNAGVALPSTGIQVIHRSDGSGTTASFTAYLTAAAPAAWTVGSGKDVPWPTGQGAKGSDGVTAAVRQTNGAIGYSEVSFAKGAGLSMAKIKNAGGAYVAPDGAAVATALKSAAVPPDLKIRINYAPIDPSAYPISTTTFVIVPQRPTDPAKARLLKSFVDYALGQGQKAADALYYAPLPSSLVSQGRAALGSITG